MYKLAERMDQQLKAAVCMLLQGNGPDANAVVDLPRVELVCRILLRALADVADVQEQLPHILEAELVCLVQI